MVAPRAVVFAAVLTLAWLGPAAAREWRVAPAHLAVVEGEVLVQASGTSAWVPAIANLPLGPGDWVWVVARGGADVRVSWGISIRLAEATRVVLRALPAGDAQLTRIGVERGGVTIAMTRAEPRHLVGVDLGWASLRATPPGVFRSEVFPDGSVEVSVPSGAVITETVAGPIEVGSGQNLRLEPGGAPQVSALPGPDSSDRGTELRDRQSVSLSGGSYLPAELMSYTPDLLAFGRWGWILGYGHVWAPRVSPDWTPYSQGQWLPWRDQYVWVSDEPWGWVPYHYGRWLFYPPTGWVWVPPLSAQVVWNPGAVGWMEGPGFVAWCPLAPGEPDLQSVNGTNIQVTNVFINARVAKALIVARQDAFLAGRRAAASRSSMVELVKAGGRVVHELRPGALRVVNTPASPGVTKPIAVPMGPAKRFDFDGGVLGSRGSVFHRPSQPEPPTQSSPGVTLPGGAGVLLAPFSREPAPPPSTPQPAQVVTPPAAQGNREAGPAPRAPSSPASVSRGPAASSGSAAAYH